MNEKNPTDIGPRELGTRLQDARKDRGLTQQQVADQLGVARTTITAIEKGERQLKPDELLQLAAIYGRPLWELLRQGPTTPSFAVQFRAALKPRHPEADAAISAAVTHLKRLCDNYVYLETITESPNLTPPPLQYEVRGLPAERAGELLSRYERNALGLGQSPIGDLRALLEEERAFRVFVLDLPGQISGMFAFTTEHGTCVAVNRKHPPQRRRWSLCHEYGHFLANRYEADILTVEELESPSREDVANAFARNFLMPTEAVGRRFDQLYQQHGGQITPADLISLADYFGVSFMAMTLRLEHLRRIPFGTWDRLTQRGFRVREARAILELDHDTPEERRFPKRYELLAVWAYASEKITEGQLAELLELDRLSTREKIRDVLAEAGVEGLESLAELLAGEVR